ncbi:hypothetical protein PMG11_04880 [Penicillium brasilianum]|uniref:Uncharacterized protein n=1 Tax=Penicillium brasilianum TaxID=104259 RepID=A0A0F7VDV7_PENBI|nr:hypothetical protein PMG11_04880 [Penicillium brasilianum]
MLLNLGLAADAAAAHSIDPAQPESPPASALPYSPSFAFPALPFLDTFRNRLKQPGPATPAGPTSTAAMSPVMSTPTEGESSTAASSALARPRANRAPTFKKSSRSKTSYQFAHPASHARHKRLRLRPKLLLQVQQVSQTPRPLPIIDVLPSTMYLPRLARKFPALFRRKNGLGPYDVIIVMSELYESTRATIPEKHASSEDDDEDHREVVATVCQMLQEEARLKGKAEICLNFGPVWEATPLPSGSYEFVAHTNDGTRVMRWALRGGKTRRGTVSSGSQTRDDMKRFTFSVIDPNTRRHPVIASMTKNQLEVNDEYSAAVARTTNGPTTPSSGMSVVSDMSDTEAPVDANDVVILDDALRTLIIVTGIWVAFREGWSQNFNYADSASAPNGKGVTSPTSSTKYSSPTATKIENENEIDRDEFSPVQDFSTGKRCMSISSMKRANTMTPPEAAKGAGSLSRRSNSTGAAFMDRAKRRSASAATNRHNRHSMFTGTGENGRDIVVSRPPSLRQNSVEPDDSPHRFDGLDAKLKANAGPEIPKLTLQPDRGPELTLDGASDVPSKESEAGKTKRRHRLSSLFTIFHRKH